MAKKHMSLTVTVDIEVEFEVPDPGDEIEYALGGIWLGGDQIAETVEANDELDEKVLSILQELVDDLRDEAKDAGGSGRRLGC